MACGGGGGGGGGSAGGGGGTSSAATLSIGRLNLTSQTHSSIAFTWEAQGAAEFRIFRAPFTTATKDRIATTSATTYTDSGLGFKQAYSYEVAACRNTTDPDAACVWSGVLEPFSAAPSGLYFLALAQVATASLAADFGLARVGARWVFADPQDPAQRPTLDYTVREIIPTGVRISASALDPRDPATTVGEIGVDGRLGLFVAGVTGATPDKTIPYLPSYDLMVAEALYLPAAPVVGQTWTTSTASATNCERHDGTAALCEQRVVVTSSVQAHSDTFATLCARSALVALPVSLKPFKVVKTHEFEAIQPETFKSRPKETREYWLAAGLGFVASRRTVEVVGSIPQLGSGNHCLVGASGQ